MPYEILKKQIYINVENLEKSILHILKVSELIDLTDRHFRKTMKIEESEFQANDNFLYEFLQHFENYQKIYYIILLELCNEITVIGLDFFPAAFFKLFQSFKTQILLFLRYNTQYFIKKKLYSNNEDFLKKTFNFLKKTSIEEEAQELIEYLKLSRNMRKSQINTMSGDKFAKLEKARLLLIGEGYELENLINQFEQGKEEIDLVLKSRDMLDKFNCSGANKILEKVLESLKKDENGSINYENLMGLIDKNFQKLIGEKLQGKDLLNELTKKILIKLDNKQKKKKNEATTKNISEIFEEISVDKETQVLINNKKIICLLLF